jgi:class 3 adenylate cyclase
MERPRTQFARSGDVNVAYQVWGEGPFDVVFVPPFVSHVELLWDVGCWAAFNERLGSVARMITFDKRGTGMSDRVPGVQTLEERMDDLRAVMDAAGSEQAAIIGLSEGGALAALFGAVHPERVWGLVLMGAVARFGAAPGYPSRHTEDEFRQFVDAAEAAWRAQQVDEALAFLLPLGEERDRRALERMFLLGASPGAAAALLRMNGQIDVRGVLDSLRVPTLVLWFEQDMEILVEGSRYLAEHIPGARAVELPGPGHFPFTSEEAVSHIESFLRDSWEAERLVEREADRVLTTVLFTDIVGSTEHLARLGDHAWGDLLDRHRTIVRHELMRHRGTEIDAPGDGFLACFDGPARALRCAEALVDDLSNLELEIRAGVHTGECERSNGKVAGLAVHIGARIADRARAGEILVSRTVRDLVVGSGLAFASRGSFELKGVPGEWELFALEPSAGSPR